VAVKNFQDNILIFDLHNTLYDEVLEYGQSMAAMLQYFFSAASEQGVALDEDVFFAQLREAHARAGSDWDDDVWRDLDALKKLSNLDAIIGEAVSLRREKSKKFTKDLAYVETLDCLRELDEAGATLVLATEATANAAADAVQWLGLDGVIDAVYSWPYAKPYTKLERTKQCFTPAYERHSDLYLQKPHALILGMIVLDVAKERGDVPVSVSTSDVYDLVIDESIDISQLMAQIKEPEQNPLIVETVKSLRKNLEIKDGPYKRILEELWSRTFFVGDSFFKDGFLARNAGLPFIYAKYGKKVDDQEWFDVVRDVLYRVTGWDPFLLQLTHEASKLPALTAQIKPYFTCEDSLKDFINFRKDKKYEYARL
jgi:phosphoglycolate phosphatase-like HAD superfamily hydrolase